MLFPPFRVSNEQDTSMALNISMGIPEVGAPGEDEAVKAISGAHGMNHDVRERPTVEPFELYVVAEGG